jgi:hypothetical protein
MTGRSRQMRQTTTEVRLDEGKAEVSALRAGQPHDLVASRAGCEGILLRGTFDETDNRTQQRGYPGDVG